jgi:hypothetical protein
MKEPLLSFHGKQEIKDKYVERVKLHAAADEIIQGTYWQNGKGCAVGCTVHSADHSAYETELGIPRIIARLEDRIFERLTNGEAKAFPLRFITAVPVGKDLTPVWKKFLVWLLVDSETGAIRYAKKDETRKAIQDVADLIEKSLLEHVTSEQFIAVRKVASAYDAAYAAADAAAAAAAYDAAYAAAYDAADAADAAYAAAYAADAYAAAYAADAADAAADAAAYAAAYAADAAAYAAADAAYDAAYAAAAAYKKAKVARFSQLADKLIQLLSEV